MKVYKSSLHAKIYSWVYVTEKLPKSLCVYFWKLVLCVILIPITIFVEMPLRLAFLIKCLFIKLFGDNDAGKFLDTYNIDNLGKKMSVGFVAWIILALMCGFCEGIVVMCRGHYTLYTNPCAAIVYIVGVVLTIFIMLCACMAIEQFIENRRRKRKESGLPPKVTVWKIGKKAIKGFLNRYCSTLDWE